MLWPGKIVPSCVIELNLFISILNFPKLLFIYGLHGDSLCHGLHCAHISLAAVVFR